jgi:hypothetical protein
LFSSSIFPFRVSNRDLGALARADDLAVEMHIGEIKPDREVIFGERPHPCMQNIQTSARRADIRVMTSRIYKNTPEYFPSF